MNKWVARFIQVTAATWALWALIERGWWLLLAAVLAAVVVAIEPWCEHSLFRSSS